MRDSARRPNIHSLPDIYINTAVLVHDPVIVRFYIGKKRTMIKSKRKQFKI